MTGVIGKEKEMKGMKDEDEDEDSYSSYSRSSSYSSASSRATSESSYESRSTRSESSYRSQSHSGSESESNSSKSSDSPFDSQQSHGRNVRVSENYTSKQVASSAKASTHRSIDVTNHSISKKDKNTNKDSLDQSMYSSKPKSSLLLSEEKLSHESNSVLRSGPRGENGYHSGEQSSSSSESSHSPSEFSSRIQTRGRERKSNNDFNRKDSRENGRGSHERSSKRRSRSNGQKRMEDHFASSGTSDTLNENNKSFSNRGRLDRALTGVPLRRAQSPTTTISSLSASQITGGFSMEQRRRFEAEDMEDGRLPIGDTKLKKGNDGGQRNLKNPALHDLEANLQEALDGIAPDENRKGVRELVAQDGDSDHEKLDSVASGPHTSHRLLHGFEALLGALLQLSDELELVSTFGSVVDGSTTVVSSEALNAVLAHAPQLDSVFSTLKPILQHYLEEEPDDEIDHLLVRCQKLVRLLCELTYRVCQRQEWNPRAETAYVTLLELLDRTTLEVTCVYDEVSIPKYQVSGNLRRAWSATGHLEELKTLYVANDTWLFRQVCYEVLVSTDHWCPNVKELGLVCDVATGNPDDDINAPNPDARLAPTPPAALQILDKVNGDPLSRPGTLGSILRRILPPHAMTDTSILDSFSSIRSTIRNPLGISGSTNTIAISSVPEALNDPDAMGMAGVGKTTMAAIVANHPDVRRFYQDGVAWIYLGPQEMTYVRYTHCLRELISQLSFYDGVPLFAELLHTPGEPRSKRLRREEGFMVYARDTVSELLHRRNVLVILDDVYYESDLEWFQFVPQAPPQPKGKRNKVKNDIFSCSIVITTRCRDLLPAADTVEIDLMDEQDAIKLLVTESGQPPDHIMAESKEARSVVRECANHPLAVKTVGRWLSLKHATAGVISSVEEIHEDVVKSIDRVLQNQDPDGPDMIYEIMGMSFSPAVNGEPTKVIKLCFAAFVQVFCKDEEVIEYSPTGAPPMIPWVTAELLFEEVLEMEESTLFEEGNLFHVQRKEAIVLIPEALSALGVLKLVTTFEIDDSESRSSARQDHGEERFLQIMHGIQREYGHYLCDHDPTLKAFTIDCERRWNRAFVEAYMRMGTDWESTTQDASRDYALEMIVTHMLRADMFEEASRLLSDESFARGRMHALGRESATRRHVADCEKLYDLTQLLNDTSKGRIQLNARTSMIRAYEAFGAALGNERSENGIEEQRLFSIESGRAHYAVGFSLAERRCWSAAIAHWESSQELLLSSLGMVEFVAAILYNVGIVYAEMNEYEQALASLKQCLRIRVAIHGEEHILYAQTIQKIGDVFLGMSDYTEAMESYNWAMDVMHIEPSHHRVDIGDILDNMGNIHYSKGEVPQALRCYQDALRSKKVELGDDHPELSITYQHIGNCLSDQGDTDEAIAHFEEAIRLKELDPDGGDERDADIASIEGVLNNLTGRQEEGLKCYERSLEILATKAPHKKEKIAALFHLIGCVHLMNGEHKKAMKLFEESLQARRKVLGFVHLDVASTLFNMAFLHQTRNRLDKALKCLEEALKIRQLRLPNSEKVALTHEKIGTLAKAIGKSKKAEISFEEALRIRRFLHGNEHEAVATVLHEIGDLMDDLGEYDEAMSNYENALSIRRKILGDHEDVAATLYSMGFTLHNLEEPEKALDCFKEALTIRKDKLGNDAKEVGDTLNMMGFLQAKRGELDNALTLLWDALRIRKTHRDHVKVSETLKNIGNVHREKQEHDLAVECYEECLRIRRSELGDDHEKVADALIAIGNVRSDMENINDAMRAYKEAHKIRSLVHGENDERVAAVLQYMGTLEFRSGELDAARFYLQDFINIRQENRSEHDGDYVNVLFMIGNIHKIQGEDNKAKECWSEAYDVFQELGLALENPQIAKVMNSLLHGENRPHQQQSKPQEGVGYRMQDSSQGAYHQQTRTKAKSNGLLGKLSNAFKDTLRDEKMYKYPSSSNLTSHN
jgi:tetratricopeptide (TPR) repeat protein